MDIVVTAFSMWGLYGYLLAMVAGPAKTLDAIYDIFPWCVTLDLVSTDLLWNGCAVFQGQS